MCSRIWQCRTPPDVYRWHPSRADERVSRPAALVLTPEALMKMALSMFAVALIALASAVLQPVANSHEARRDAPPGPIKDDTQPEPDVADSVPSGDVFDPRENSSRLIPTERSISMFEQRARRMPGDHRNLVVLGRLHLRLAKESGNHRLNHQAEAALRKALRIKPDDPSATTCLAQALSAQHRFAEAQQLADALLQQDADNIEALAVAGDTRLQLGLYDEARARYRQLVDLRGGPAVLARLAELEEITGNSEQAEASLRLAHQRIQDADATDDSLAWYELRLGEFLLRNGQPKVAATHFREALLLKDEYEPAVFRLGLAEAAMRNHELATSILQTTADLHTNPSAWAALGDIHHINGRDDEAEHCYVKAEAIFELQAKASTAHSRTAALFYADRHRSPERAMKLIQMDLRSRQSVESLDALAWVQFRSGDEETATQTIQKALKYQTRSAILHYHAGMIFESAGEPERAATHFETALAVNPEFSLLFSNDARVRLNKLKGAE